MDRQDGKCREGPKETVLVTERDGINYDFYFVILLSFVFSDVKDQGKRTLDSLLRSECPIKFYYRSRKLRLPS